MKHILAVATAICALATAVPVLAQGQPVTLTILSHAVHQNVARGLVGGTTGGDIVGEWAARNNVEINWITGGIDPIHDRLFRELALGETVIDLAFIIDRYMTPRITGLLEPLDPYNAASPVESLSEIPDTLLQFTRHEGALIAIPYRHSTGGLHWNRVLFAERGLDRAPMTGPELVDYARQLTYRREDGTRVVGFVGNFGEGYGAAYGFLNLFGVRLFDDDMNVTADTPEMVEGLSTMAALYKDGALPSNYATIGIDEAGAAIMDGRAAMAFGPFARYTVYNNPNASRFPGEIRVATNPVARLDPPQQGTEIWSMAIPRNARNKDLAWSLIRELSTYENTVRAALNGNSPVMPVVYQDERYKAIYPYTAEEAASLAVARPLVSFANSQQAWAIFSEEVQAAVIGLKSPQEAASEMQRRISPLVTR